MERRLLSTIGLEMPADFPVDAYEAVARTVNVDKWTQHSSWGDFGGAWNGLAYRFFACAEHDEQFTASIQLHGDAPPPPERYLQERELFGFFVTGLSALECVSYGLFALGSMVAPEHFPFSTPKEKRAVSTAETVRSLKKAFPGDPLYEALARMRNSTEYTEWGDIRNVLAHRSTPGRMFFRSVGSVRGSSPATWQQIHISIDVQTTASRRAWLVGELRTLLEASRQFTADRLR